MATALIDSLMRRAWCIQLVDAGGETTRRREPASFSALYAPNGDEYRYKSMAREQASRQQDEHWMGWLRQQAGLKPDWLPPDEAKKDEAARG